MVAVEVADEDEGNAPAGFVAAKEAEVEAALDVVAEDDDVEGVDEADCRLVGWGGGIGPIWKGRRCFSSLWVQRFRQLQSPTGNDIYISVAEIIEGRNIIKTTSSI